METKQLKHTCASSPNKPRYPALTLASTRHRHRQKRSVDKVISNLQIDPTLPMSYARSDEQGKDTLFFVTSQDSEMYTGDAEIKDSSRERADKSTEKVDHDEKDDEDDGEEKQEEAYNEETGEINWDCPCIAGMTKEPCGDKFKDAFSCFVYSKQEPKGSECVEQFRIMQDCFAAHPEIYGNQDDGEGDSEGGQEVLVKTGEEKSQQDTVDASTEKIAIV